MPPTRNPRRDHAHDLPAIPGLAALNTGLGNESASHPDTPSPARRSEHTARAHPATPPTSRSPTMQTCMNNTECLGLLTIVRTISDPTNGSGGGVGRRASPVGSVFKKATIISDFRKCGLGPIDESAVPRELFEPVLNYTTQAAQPLPPCLPSLLIPIATDATSTMTTTRSSTASSSTATSHPSATSGNASGSGTPPNLSAGSSPSSASLSATSSHLSATVPRPSTPPRPSDATHAEEVVQALYKIAVPSPLHKTASRKALAAENDQLRKIALAAGVELEKNHASERSDSDGVPSAPSSQAAAPCTRFDVAAVASVQLRVNCSSLESDDPDWGGPRHLHSIFSARPRPAQRRSLVVLEPPTLVSKRMPPTRNPRRDHARGLPAIPGLAALNAGLGIGSPPALHPDTSSPADRSKRTARAHPATPRTSRSPTMQTGVNNTECLALLTIVRAISLTNGGGGGVGRRASPVGSVAGSHSSPSEYSRALCFSCFSPREGDEHAERWYTIYRPAPPESVTRCRWLRTRGTTTAPFRVVGFGWCVPFVGRAGAHAVIGALGGAFAMTLHRSCSPSRLPRGGAHPTQAQLEVGGAVWGAFPVFTLFFFWLHSFHSLLDVVCPRPPLLVPPSPSFSRTPPIFSCGSPSASDVRRPTSPATQIAHLRTLPARIPTSVLRTLLYSPPALPLFRLFSNPRAAFLAFPSFLFHPSFLPLPLPPPQQQADAPPQVRPARVSSSCVSASYMRGLVVKTRRGGFRERGAGRCCGKTRNTPATTPALEWTRLALRVVGHVCGTSSSTSTRLVMHIRQSRPPRRIAGGASVLRQVRIRCAYPSSCSTVHPSIHIFRAPAACILPPLFHTHSALPISAVLRVLRPPANSLLPPPSSTLPQPPTFRFASAHRIPASHPIPLPRRRPRLRTPLRPLPSHPVRPSPPSIPLLSLSAVLCLNRARLELLALA
ncbi:hypothetical protein B0H10DRAFT_2209449 [Mycena sp. CBHHK59/15]|nr:hypothetical protein B0H10DRAFT_2209449 [Mycena sp. CBHHK59/15]